MTTEQNKIELRNFGLTFGALFFLFFYMLIPYIRDFEPPKWILYFSIAVSVLGLVLPISLRPIHFVWIRLGIALGWINTRIILGLVFFFVVFPIGVLLKLSGKDFMRDQIDKNLDSYRETSEDRDIQTIKQLF